MKIFLLLNTPYIFKTAQVKYLSKMVSKGQTCIDIGSHLGYYSAILSRLVGETGSIFSVYPSPTYKNIWQHNVKMSSYKNISTFILTTSFDSTIKNNDNLNSITLKRIDPNLSDQLNFARTNEQSADDIFSELKEINFITCNVDGLESIVFSNMTKTLRVFRPIVQSNLSGLTNRRKVIYLFEELEYSIFILKSNTLKTATERDILGLHSKFYFYPNERLPS